MLRTPNTKLLGHLPLASAGRDRRPDPHLPGREEGSARQTSGKNGLGQPPHGPSNREGLPTGGRTSGNGSAADPEVSLPLPPRPSALPPAAAPEGEGPVAAAAAPADVEPGGGPWPGLAAEPPLPEPGLRAEVEGGGGPPASRLRPPPAPPYPWPRSPRSTCCPPPAAAWPGWPGAARSASAPSPGRSGWPWRRGWSGAGAVSAPLGTRRSCPGAATGTGGRQRRLPQPELLTAADASASPRWLTDGLARAPSRRRLRGGGGKKIVLRVLTPPLTHRPSSRGFPERNSGGEEAPLRPGSALGSGTEGINRGTKGLLCERN